MYKHIQICFINVYATNTVNASGAHVYTSPQYPKKQRHSLGLAELRHGTHAGQTWHLWNMQPQLSLHSRTIKRRSTLVIWSEQKQQEVLVVNPISPMPDMRFRCIDSASCKPHDPHGSGRYGSKRLHERRNSCAKDTDGLTAQFHGCSCASLECLKFSITTPGTTFCS